MRTRRVPERSGHGGLEYLARKNNLASPLAKQPHLRCPRRSAGSPPAQRLRELFSAFCPRGAGGRSTPAATCPAKGAGALSARRKKSISGEAAGICNRRG